VVILNDYSARKKTGRLIDIRLPVLGIS